MARSGVGFRQPGLRRAGAAAAAVAAPGVSDHGALTGLADDDHAGYVRGAGRAGGQTVTGGTADGEDLILLSTSGAVKGKIRLGTASAYDQVNDRLGIGTLSPGADLDVSKATAAGTVTSRVRNSDGAATANSARHEVAVASGSTGNAEIWLHLEGAANPVRRYKWRIDNATASDPLILYMDAGGVAVDHPAMSFLPQSSNIAGVRVGINIASPGATLDVVERSGDNTCSVRTLASSTVTNPGFQVRNSNARIAHFALGGSASGITVGGESLANRFGLYDDTGGSAVLGMFLATKTATPIKFITTDIIRLALLAGGTLEWYGTTAPAGNPAAGRMFQYLDSADGRMKLKDPAGNITPLTP